MLSTSDRWLLAASTMLIISLIAVLSLCYYTYFRASRWRLYELAEKLPGIPTLPFIGNAHQFAGNSEHIMKMIKYVSELSSQTKYVIKVWLGPRLYVSVSNPEDAEVCLKMCLEKDDLHNFLRPLTGHGLIFAPDGNNETRYHYASYYTVSIWKHRRKIVLPAFNKKILNTFVEVFNEQSDILVNILHKSCGKGPIQINRMLNCCTLDSVSETAMGVKLQTQGAQTSSYLEAVEALLDILCKRIFHVWMHPNILFNITYGPTQSKLISQIHDFTDVVVRERRIQYQKSCQNNEVINSDIDENFRKPFLDLLISLSGSKENLFGNVALREEVLVFIIAGTDTSALGLGYTLTMLGAYPDVQEKAYQEVLNVVGLNDPITKDNLPKFVYLEKVIKESLRLYPPVPLIIRKVEQDVKLPSGYTLPTGSGAVVNIFHLHRNKQQWGPDAEDFNPDRFDDNKRHPCTFIPFSSGPRNCLGYQYAMMSMKTVTANILRNFKIKAKPYDRLKIEIMMRPAEGLCAAFETRHVQR